MRAVKDFAGGSQKFPRHQNGGKIIPAPSAVIFANLRYSSTAYIGLPSNYMYFVIHNLQSSC